MQALWTPVHTLPSAAPDDAQADEAAAAIAKLHAMLIAIATPPSTTGRVFAPATTTRPSGCPVQQSSIISPGEVEFTAPLPAAAHRGIYNDSLGRALLHQSAVVTADAAKEVARVRAAAAFSARRSQDDVLVSRRMQMRARPVRQRAESVM